MRRYNDELYHYGRKGMKWGEHIFGVKQRVTERVNHAKRQRELNRTFRDPSNYSKKQLNETNNRYESERKFKNNLDGKKLEGGKRLTDASSGMVNTLQNINNKQIKNAPRQKMDLSSMSDQELRNQLNRAILEKQYNDMFNPPTVSKGRTSVSDTLSVAGDVLAVTSSALAIALAIKELKG